MAMENGPVEDVFPIENGDLLVYWRVRCLKEISFGCFA